MMRRPQPWRAKPARWLVLPLLLAAIRTGVCAGAATPLAEYFAARNRALAALAGNNQDTAANDALETAALGDLEQRLRRIVGPIGIPGFPDVGTSNLETLSPGVGLGKLDALTAAAADGTKVWVTTLPLLNAWLAGHRDAWQARPGMSAVAAAFRSDDFYTDAISSDVHATIYTALPLTARPGDADVTALLVLFAQDSGPYLPSDLIVALVRHGRAIIFDQPVAVAAIPPCQATWEQAHAAAASVLAGARTVPVAKQVFDRYLRLDAAASGHFVRCFREGLKSTPGYAALSRKAAVLLDLPEP
jgi:hypothetical protein